MAVASVLAVGDQNSGYRRCRGAANAATGELGSMTRRLLGRVAGPLAAGAVLSLGTAGAALAQTPTVDKGDTAFMFLSTIIVLLMTVPGLALFYGGLVRSKNMLSILMQVFAITCMVSIIWVTYGYSLAFTNGGALN